MELSLELKQKIEQYQNDGVLLAKFTVDTNEKYEQAIMLGKQIQNKIKELETEKKKITDPIEQSKKAVIELFRKPLEVLTSAKNLINSQGLMFCEKQERIRLEAEQKLRLESEAKQRKIDEQIAKKQAEGKSTEKLEQKKAEIITPVLQSNVTKVSGTYIKETHKARVIDFKLLPDEYKIVNQMLIDGIAKTTDGKAIIPGVEMYIDKQLINRG